jgi:hypothetical protein
MHYVSYVAAEYIAPTLRLSLQQAVQMRLHALSFFYSTDYIASTQRYSIKQNLCAAHAQYFVCSNRLCSLNTTPPSTADCLSALARAMFRV